MNRAEAIYRLVILSECPECGNHDFVHARTDLALLELGVAEEEITRARQALDRCQGMDPPVAPRPDVAMVAVEDCVTCGRGVPLGGAMFYTVGRGGECVACGERGVAAWWAEYHRRSARWRARLAEVVS